MVCSILYLLQTSERRCEAFSNKITGRLKMEINFYLHTSETSAGVFHSLSTPIYRR